MRRRWRILIAENAPLLLDDEAEILHMIGQLIEREKLASRGV